MACWCGERRPYYETASALLSSSCAGTGELDCLCGGDQCVCHNHGTVECPGCGACQYCSFEDRADSDHDAAMDAR